MKTISKRERIEGVLDSLKRQYPNDENGTIVKLKGINWDTITEKEIKEIIGNDSWTRLECCNCEKNVDLVLELNVKYEENSLLLCEDCVIIAKETMKQIRERKD